MNGLIVKKKAYATLLEVLIAMVLMSILISALAFFYRFAYLNQNKQEKAATQSFQLAYLNQRLSDVMTGICSENEAKKNFVFSSTSLSEHWSKAGSSSLLFIFDNGFQLVKGYSNKIIGRIYLDSEGRLMLIMIPSPETWDDQVTTQSKLEVLAEDVEQLEFSFYQPKRIGKLDQEEGKREVEWPSEKRSLPPLIKMILRKKDEKNKTVFSFYLPNASQIITYDQ